MKGSASPSAVPVFIRDRRWWWLLGILWLAVVILSALFNIRAHRTQTEAVAVEGARNMFRMVVLARSWNASHGGVYVPVGPNVQPNPYLTVPNRDVTTTDGQRLTLINPAYMTRLIGELSAGDSGTRFRITSLRPLQPANAPLEWERQALESFENGLPEYIQVNTTEQGRELHYMAPLRVEPACLACHAGQGYKLGDIRGGISIAIPYGPIAAAQQISQRAILLAHALVFLIVAFIGWSLLSLLRRRWLELADMVVRLESSHRQMLQSEKLASVGQLAAGVAHEINNPLGYVSSNLNSLGHYVHSLVGLVEVGRKEVITPEACTVADYDFIKDDVQGLLQESRDGLGRVKKVVADLMDFAQLDHQEWRETTLKQCVEDTLGMLGHELRGRAGLVEVHGEPALVRCIPSQIHQVLMNLLLNAVQALEEDGIITIRTGAGQEQAWVRVEDNGVGMSPEILQQVFEPFFSTRPAGTGSGLGLAVARDIARRHRGELMGESELGQGSVFTLYLPLAALEPNPA